MVTLKRFWTGLALTLAFCVPSLWARAASFGFTAPASNAVIVLPPTGIEGFTNAWATSTVYTAGARVLVNSRVYSCAVPGTSGTNVLAMAGYQVTDGSVTWIRCQKALRQGFAITVSSVGDVYVTYDVLAASGKGVWLPAGGSPHQFSPTDAYQGRLSLYSTSSVEVTGMEW